MFDFFFPTCQVRAVGFYVSSTPRPPPSPPPRRTSTASPRSQCSPPGPNSKLRIRVFPAGLQLQAGDRSVPCQTSTHKESPKIYQIECQKECQKICQIHMPARMSEELPDRLPGGKRRRGQLWWNLETKSLDFIRVVRDCQNICQIECFFVEITRSK